MKIFRALILFLTFSFTTATLHSEQPSAEKLSLHQALLNISQKITLSNFSEDERNHNLQLCDFAYEIICECAKEIEQFPFHFQAFLELSYKLANCFQQNDRAAHGEIVSRLALLALEKKFPLLASLEPADACTLLVHENPLLPSLYAATLHYLAKSYFYLPNHVEPDNENLLNISERQLKRAIDLRSIIDSAPELYLEPIDSGKLTYTSHTTLFLRTYGMILFNKHAFSEAQILYERFFFEETLEFEKAMSALRLVSIYSNLAREQWDPNESYSLYKKAHEKALFVESYMFHNRHSG